MDIEKADKAIADLVDIFQARTLLSKGRMHVAR